MIWYQFVKKNSGFQKQVAYLGGSVLCIFDQIFTHFFWVKTASSHIRIPDELEAREQMFLRETIVGQNITKNAIQNALNECYR